MSGNWINHPHTGTARTATIASLTAATSYQVQVLAVNSDGDGSFSDPGAGTTGTVTTNERPDGGENASDDSDHQSGDRWARRSYTRFRTNVRVGQAATR